MDGNSAGRAVILLGAGASVEAGLPATVQLTHEVITGEIRKEADRPRLREEAAQQELRDLVEREAAGDRIAAAQLKEWRRQNPNRPERAFQPPDPLELVYGRLRAQAASVATGDLEPKVDLEDLVTTLDELADRGSRGLSAFVHDWIPELLAVDHESGGWTTEVDVGRYDSRLIDFVRSRVERRLTPGRGEPFRHARARVVRAVRERLGELNEDQLDYLRPLVAWAHDSGRPIFTLNHDMALELAASRAGLSWHHGLDEWKTGRSISFPPGAVGVAKLHGSIDWADLVERGDPGFLFGGVNKLTVQGPYLHLLFALSSELSDADRLVVIGYSFRDAHINGLLQRFLRDCRRRNLSPSVTIVDPAYPDGDVLPGSIEPRAQEDRPEVKLTIVRQKTGPALAAGVLDE